MDARAIFDQDRLMSLLGVDMVIGRPGHVVLRYVVDETIVQTHGSCHGGVIFALADAACGIAGNTGDASAVTQTGTITYLAPAHVGDILIATARQRSASGRTQVIDVDVATEAGTLIAEFRGFLRTTSARK